MTDMTFTTRLQAIESAFRHLAILRFELEQSGIWKPGKQDETDSDYYQFFMEISCKLSDLYLNKEVSHE